MNFKTLTDAKLIEDLKQTVHAEREVTLKVLWLLREVERRMLYAARGYSSLFQYCISELKYSESSAQRRISSMRLLRDLDQESRVQVEKKISEGKLNLSHLNQLQQHCRREEQNKKSTQKPIVEAKPNADQDPQSKFPESAQESAKSQSQEKLALIDKISGTSARECEQILASISTAPVEEQEKIRAMDADRSRVTFVASKALLAKIKRLQNSKAHQLKSNSISEILELLVNEELKRDEKKKGVSLKVKSPVAASREHSTSEGRKETAHQSRYIPRETVRRLYEEADHQCQFLDPITQKRCDSRYKLQVEHCQPFALGGSNELDNLMVHCSTHNALKARRVFGESYRDCNRGVG